MHLKLKYILDRDRWLGSSCNPRWNAMPVSSSKSKRKAALTLSASELYATKGVTNLTDLAMEKPVKYLLLAKIRINYPLLDKHAKTHLTTYVTAGDLVVLHPEIPSRGPGIIGTKIGLWNKMLDFAARNKVAPYIERFPLSVDGTQAVIKKLQDGTIRYRGVLVYSAGLNALLIL
uniref:Uncharacterized protein n=1 Tax=Moniliophthora roreri TaxID=221103 RepID=A0A0W0FV93_MONRR